MSTVATMRAAKLTLVEKGGVVRIAELQAVRGYAYRRLSPALRLPVKSTRRLRARHGLARRSKTEFPADIDELNTPVDRRTRVLRILQLLLAEANRFKHGRIDPERVDQSFADGLG